MHLDQANRIKSENTGNPEFLLPVIWLRAMTDRSEQPGWQVFDQSLQVIEANNHGRYITFQLSEVDTSRPPFAEILRLIDGLRPRTSPKSEPRRGRVV